jgi:hypothetical protein
MSLQSGDESRRGKRRAAIWGALAQNAAKTKTVREVVDGQQRIRSVPEFINDGEIRWTRR